MSSSEPFMFMHRSFVRSFLYLIAVAVLITGVVVSGFSQQSSTPPTGKEALVLKLRLLTGANQVNLNFGASMDDIKSDLIGSVDNDKDLTDSQKIELRKEAAEAYSRLDQQLRAFLNDSSRITPLSEAAVFEVYDKAFTEAELNELIAFYSTPTGKKAALFYPTLSSQVSQAMQAKILPVVQDFIGPKIKGEGDQLKQKIQQTKAKKG